MREIWPAEILHIYKADRESPLFYGSFTATKAINIPEKCSQRFYDDKSNILFLFLKCYQSFSWREFESFYCFKKAHVYAL